MKLGLALGYWGAQPPSGVGELVAEAERLGFDSLWTSEAYGSDALTPLSWWGSRTTSLRLGTAVAQMPARTPAATAMAAVTLDHLSRGRLILGLGVSGPQVVEGWHGTPFARPLAMTREYLAVLRQILAREAPLEFSGEYFRMPLPGGPGKSLSITTHPLRPGLPIWLGAEGPRNIALAAEIADGWLAGFHSPEHSGWQAAALAQGFARDGARRQLAEFEIAATLPLVLDDDLERAADRIRPLLALYIGGMGSATSNFHYDLFCRIGYEAAAARIRDLYLGGQRAEAAAAVPTRLVEEVGMIGPMAKLREEVERWRSGLPTLLMVAGSPAQLRVAAELFL